MFKEWISNVGKTLWCPGIPGAGKTILASTIINHLESFPPQNGFSLAYLYCNYKERDAQTTSNLVASLLRQLLQQQSDLPDAVTSSYKNHLRKGTRPMLTELSSLLLLVVKKTSDVFIIIDALDEYIEEDGSRDKFLTEIKKLEPSIHLLITSRWVPSIELEFEHSVRLDIRARDEDITKYLTERIHETTRLKTHVEADPSLLDTIVNTLVENCQGMFLLAQLHIDSLLKQPHRKAVRLALKQLPKGLDDTYDEAMQRIGSQAVEDVELAHQTLSWISYARRPLQISELQHALAVEPGGRSIEDDSLIDEALLISLCAGLVTVDHEGGIIRLVHFTTQEYFKRTCEQHFPDAKQKIAATCITSLLFDAFEEGHCSSNQGFRDRLRQYPFLDYAGKYWGYHARGNTQQIVKDLAVELLMDDNKASNAGQALWFNKRSPGCFYGLNDWKLYGIHLVACFGLEDMMTMLLQIGTDVGAKDNNGLTALHWAAAIENEAMVQLLVKKGADVRAINIHRRSALHLAVKTEQPAIVQLLVEKGANINAKDNYKETVFHSAVEGGHKSIVQYLIEKNAEVEAKGFLGATALHMAASRGQTAMVQLLIEKADIEAKDNMDQTALHRAAKNGHKAIVHLLIQKADIEAKDNWGQTALHCASKNGHKAIVHLLIQKADIEAKDNMGQTALHCASENGHEAIVQLLIEKGVDVDATDDLGRTALHWTGNSTMMSRHRGHLGVIVVQLLIGKGANVKARDKNGKTALDLAAKSGSFEIVQLLQEAMKQS